MPIVGIIPPTKGTGPIIVIPYVLRRSVDDVFTLIRQNNPLSFQNEAMKPPIALLQRMALSSSVIM
jgi:hypothetical protein